MGRGGGGGRRKGGGGGAAATAGQEPPPSRAGGEARPAAATASPANPAPPTPSGVVAAFEASPGAARNNYVELADLRDRLGGTRAEQDAAIKQAWRDRAVTLDSHEGRFGNISQRQKDAALDMLPNPDGKYVGHDGRRYDQQLVSMSKRG